MRSIKYKVLLILFVTSIVPLVVLGYISFIKTTEQTTLSIQSSLEALVRTKNDALEQYIYGTENSARSLADTSIFREYIELLNQDLDPAGQRRFDTLTAQVADLLYAFQEANWGRYHHVFLINRANRIVVSPNHGAFQAGSPSSHLGEDTSSNQWAMKALQTGQTTVSDYSSWVESDHNHQMLFYPLKGRNRTVQAVLGFELQIPHEQQLLESSVNLGETGRIFLATTDGVPIEYQGLDERKRLPSEGLRDLQGEEISRGKRPNADGVEVIDIYLRNNRFPWILVAEIEVAEAFKELYRIQWILLTGLLVTLLIVLGMAIFFANTIVNPIKAITHRMDRVSHGELNIDIGGRDRKDEIGAMIHSFDRLIASLKILLNRMQAQKAARSRQD